MLCFLSFHRRKNTLGQLHFVKDDFNAFNILPVVATPIKPGWDTHRWRYLQSGGVQLLLRSRESLQLDQQAGQSTTDTLHDYQTGHQAKLVSYDTHNCMF